MVDQDLPHLAGSDRKEVGAPVEFHFRLIDELQIRLVDEGRRLERMTRPFVAHLGSGYPAQFIVNNWKQSIYSIVIAAVHTTQDSGHLVLDRFVTSPLGQVARFLARSNRHCRSVGCRCKSLAV